MDEKGQQLKKKNGTYLSVFQNSKSQSLNNRIIGEETRG